MFVLEVGPYQTHAIAQRDVLKLQRPDVISRSTYSVQGLQLHVIKGGHVHHGTLQKNSGSLTRHLPASVCSLVTCNKTGGTTLPWERPLVSATTIYRYRLTQALKCKLVDTEREKKKQYNEQYRLLPSDVAITGTRGYKDSQNGIIKINAVEEHNNEHSTSRYKNSNSRFLGSGPMAVDRYRIPIESNLIWRRSSFFFNGLTTYSIVTIHNHASIIQESFKGARNRAPVPIMLLPARLTD